MSLCKPRAARVMSGFTLVEMLVVMVLLGLVAGMALPSMQRWHDAVLAQSQASVMVDALRSAAFAAGARRLDLTMDELSFKEQSAADAKQPGNDAAASTGREGRVAITLPPGWTVRRVVPATFLASGLCQEGMALLDSARGDRVTLVVSGPVCGVARQTTAAGTGE